MAYEEPRIHTHTKTIPYANDLTLTFKGEQYKGREVLDTRVEIDAGCICCITWKDKEKFIEELMAVIDKYAI
jgi:G3E family GTPase